MMKKLYKALMMAVLLGGTLSSCKKTLELAPEDYFGDNNFWQTETQVTNFMVGLHKQFRDNTFMYIRLGEMRGGAYSNVDVQNTSLNELNIIEQRIEENSAGVGGWGGFYNPILQINLFLQRVGESNFLAADKKSYLMGQAYAMRAYYYFHLLRTYGGVPIWLEPEVLNGNTDQEKLRRARSTEAEVLAVVKSDINAALASFGNSASTNKYQWSPDAAKMLKGEIFLWSAKVYGNTADLAEAKSALQSISGYSLQAEFKDAFAYDKKKNSEIIFAVPFRVGEAEMPGVSAYTYSTFNFDGQHYKDSTVSAGVGNFLVDPLVIAATNSQQIIQRYRYKFELFQAYDVNDQRRDATFYDYYKVNTNTNPYTVTVRNTALVKFLGTIDANKRYFADDWPVYRESDRLLMLAEIANAENADPTQYIKAVRDRAYRGEANDPNPFVNGTQDENELAIFEERMKEFVFEGKQWYDLRRMKIAGEPMVYISPNHPYGQLDKATIGYKILWPIPADIWTNDPLVDQTPGYQTSKPR